MAALELRQLRKSFADHRVVDDLDLCVEEGSFVVLVGASGCGKSTILRLVAGLEQPDHGRVLLDGEDVTDRDPGDRDVAMVFQNYALYPHMDVRRNIGFPLRMARLPRAQIGARVEEAAALLGIAELLARKPAQLSGGQQQRVALARALVRRPKLFLFDEPLSNIDARLRAEMRAELQRLHERLGTTMLYVTHDQVEAMTLGDRIVVLHQGKVQQQGPPLAVYQQPANTYVAGFLGAPPMNLLPTPQGTIGFRPQEVDLSATEGEAFAVTVDLVEELGDQSLVHARHDGHPLLLALTPGHGLAPGDTCTIHLAPERLHHFDAAGQRCR